MDYNNTYKKSLKATSLFGGVQIYNIIIQIVRSKIVAMLLGPAGMGITGLYSSALDVISRISNCGLSTSAIRNISEASGNNNTQRISVVLSVFRRITVVTGTIGMLVCIALSPFLSKNSFGDDSHIWAFIILSVIILLKQLSAGQIVVLQGLQRYRYMARATVIGETISLLLIIPMYYFWNIKAIVPVLLVVQIVAFLLSWYYRSKIKIPIIRVSYEDIKQEGGNMLKTGILLSVSGVIGALVIYIVRSFINKTGNVGDVGLYVAGVTIVDSYVGLVFAAMVKDYYPRLAKIAKDRELFCDSINKQGEMSLLMMAPLVVVIFAFLELGIIVLYSGKFLAITNMIYWSLSSMLFKTLAWTMSYAIIAKGDTKTFFITELSIQVYSLVAIILGYKYGGLTGIGIAYFTIYIIYFFILYAVISKKYVFRFNVEVKKLFVFFSIFVFASMALKYLFSGWIVYLLESIIIIFVLFVSYKELNKRVGIKEFIYSKIKKTNNNE